MKREGLWSKAQKDAMYQLLKYARTRDEADYLKFGEFMKVNLGDRKGSPNSEAVNPIPDMQIAREGFIEGRNHLANLANMIRLVRKFPQPV